MKLAIIALGVLITFAAQAQDKRVYQLSGLCRSADTFAYLFESENSTIRRQRNIEAYSRGACTRVTESIVSGCVLSRDIIYGGLAAVWHVMQVQTKQGDTLYALLRAEPGPRLTEVLAWSDGDCG